MYYYYRQIGGVAMGSKMGPSYACLYVGYIEGQIRARCTGFVPQVTLLNARSALATIWSSISITYLTSTQLSSSHQPSANWDCRFPISHWVLTVTNYRHQCTTRKLTRITISITLHSILITTREQFPTVSFFDSTGSALMILISWAELQLDEGILQGPWLPRWTFLQRSQKSPHAELHSSHINTNKPQWKL